jgi:hypothetical protein
MRGLGEYNFNEIPSAEVKWMDSGLRKKAEQQQSSDNS